MKYSTGRGTRVPKSTGGEAWEFKKRRYKGIERIKFSTSEDAAIRHTTGKAFELRGVICQCPLCEGKGERAGGVSCPACRGEGIISLASQMGGGRRCPLCKGRGTRPVGATCPDCKGNGFIMNIQS